MSRTAITLSTEPDAKIYRDHYAGEIRVGRGIESLELRVPGR